MNETLQSYNNYINNIEILSQNEDNSEFKDEKEESQISSTSTSSINQNYDNLAFKSKLVQRNNDLLDQGPNQRKFSAPVSFTKNFVLNFNKIGKDIRGAYFNKLMNKGLLNNHEETKKFKFNNIFILDWDDTLLCTTVLSPCGYFDDNIIVLPSKMEKIQKLEILVKKLLTLMIEKGDAYIITNSEPGWVEYSCKRFFPNTYDLLNKIKIISSRGLYEKKFAKEFRKWKSMAFSEVIKNYDKTLPTNIICMGDSAYEIEAAHGLAVNFPNGFIKAIKFREYPKIDELISQLNLVLDKFNFIYSACKNWTITVDKKKKKSEKNN